MEKVSLGMCEKYELMMSAALDDAGFGVGGVPGELIRYETEQDAGH